MKTSSTLLNRREFSKAALVGGAALVCGATASPGAEISTKRIRTGVIGCGRPAQSAAAGGGGKVIGVSIRTRSHDFYKDLEEGKTVGIEGWCSVEEAAREITAARERARSQA